MRKLLIVDPTLESLEGHSYNYDRAIFGAAQSKFDEVVLYADLGFQDGTFEPSDRTSAPKTASNQALAGSIHRHSRHALGCAGNEFLP